MSVTQNKIGTNRNNTKTKGKSESLRNHRPEDFVGRPIQSRETYKKKEVYDPDLRRGRGKWALFISTRTYGGMGEPRSLGPGSTRIPYAEGEGISLVGSTPQVSMPGRFKLGGSVSLHKPRRTRDSSEKEQSEKKAQHATLVEC